MNLGIMPGSVFRVNCAIALFPGSVFRVHCAIAFFSGLVFRPLGTLPLLVLLPCVFLKRQEGPSIGADHCQAGSAHLEPDFRRGLTIGEGKAGTAKVVIALAGYHAADGAGRLRLRCGPAKKSRKHRPIPTAQPDGNRPPA